MLTKLFASLVLTVGLSACITDEEDDQVLSPDDQETVATDPGPELGDTPTDPGVVTGSGNTTCGGRPRLKADGPCLPK